MQGAAPKLAFGEELIVPKKMVEKAVTIRYYIRPRRVTSPNRDSLSIIENPKVPYSMFKKTHLGMIYYFCREYLGAWVLG